MFFLNLPSGLLVSYLGKLEDHRPDVCFHKGCCCGAGTTLGDSKVSLDP